MSEIPEEQSRAGWFDRQLLLAIVISAVVLIPRSAFIATAHSECLDAEYHLRHGIAFATGNPGKIVMNSNDPPLGQMLVALPMMVTGCMPAAPIHPGNWPKDFLMPGQPPPGEPPLSPRRALYERLIRIDLLYGDRLKPQTILLLIALWKSILFVPAAALLFHFCRSIYGAHAAWLSLVLLLFDPNVAGQIPVVALDSLGVEGVLIACFLIWRYFRAPSTQRMIALAIAIAAATLLKHTAVILPIIFVLFAIWYRKAPPRQHLAVGILCWFLALWALLLFDISRPIDQVAHLAENLPFKGTRANDFLVTILSQKWPAGAYVGCFVSGFLVNQIGQISMIFGKIQSNGFWYYFPALLTFKLPIGTGIVLAVAILSFFRRNWFREEQAILIPLLSFVIFLMFARMNYGIRHFLPAYAFLLIFAGRAIAGVARPVYAVAWLGTALTVAHSIAFFPDYISYVNFPRARIDLEITDSNLDWDQALRQIPDWAKTHNPRQLPVYVMQRTGREGVNGSWWCDDTVHFIQRGKALPSRGLLIISPVWVCGVYDADYNPYAILKSVQPIGWVGHAMPVFDLKEVQKAKSHEQSTR